MILRLQILVALLQESHYDPPIFRSWLRRHPMPKDWDRFQEKAKPVWSARAKALFFLSQAVSFGQDAFYPRALLIAHSALFPLERVLSWWMVKSAARHIRRSNIRTVIGITGSYGKTSTKEIVGSILSQEFRVYKTPENVNTLLGIAGWVRRQSFGRDDILVVEMGAYRRGDIDELCRMIRPSVGILTGINEAHLERFGTIENTKAAKSELFDALSARHGLGFWNQDSRFAAEAVTERIETWARKGTRLIPYGRDGALGFKLGIREVGETFLRLWLEKINEPSWTMEVRVPLFGAHHMLPIAAAVLIADSLGMDKENIRRGLESVRPVSRRLEPSYDSAGHLIIDDSYNITLDGARAALEVLKAIQRRKVGVFAGLPEAGQASGRLNQELGERIAPVFAAILLRKSTAGDEVKRGLERAGWNAANLFWYNESKEVQRMLGRILQPSDCVYFSAYDWPAIYL